MKRALATALLLGSLARADPPADAPTVDQQASFVEVHDGVIRDVRGGIHQVTGGAYLAHEDLIFVAQKMAALHAENVALKVIIAVSVALAVAVTMREVTR